MSFVSASRCVIMRSAIVCFGCAQEELQSLAVADSVQEAADFALVVARRVDRVLAVPGASVATQPDNQTVSNLVDSTLAQRIQDASTIPRLVLLLRKADEQLATAKNAVMDLEERLRHELMDSVDHVRQLVSTKAAEVSIAALLLEGVPCSHRFRRWRLAGWEWWRPPSLLSMIAMRRACCVAFSLCRAWMCGTLTSTLSCLGRCLPPSRTECEVGVAAITVWFC